MEIVSSGFEPLPPTTADIWQERLAAQESGVVCTLPELTDLFDVVLQNSCDEEYTSLVQGLADTMCTLSLHTPHSPLHIRAQLARQLYARAFPADVHPPGILLASVSVLPLAKHQEMLSDTTQQTTFGRVALHNTL